MRQVIEAQIKDRATGEIGTVRVTIDGESLLAAWGAESLSEALLRAMQNLHGNSHEVLHVRGCRVE